MGAFAGSITDLAAASIAGPTTGSAKLPESACVKAADSGLIG
jgi:hypothetical protein